MLQPRVRESSIRRIPGGAARRLRVAGGLALVSLYERLGERWGLMLARWLRAVGVERDRPIEPLRPWSRISDRSYATYREGATAARLSRLIELVPHHARILDIGIGYGYVTGIVLRDCKPAYYCGIDLKPTFIRATRSMMEANGLSGENVELTVDDAIKLDEDFGYRHDPDVVLVLEVLEHVPDPVRTLRAIGRVVRPGTMILFTVPLLGRLEGVWGHVSVFDRARLVGMCEAVGLRIERAEPLANRWSLLLCRTTGKTPDHDDCRNGYSFSRVPIDHPEHAFACGSGSRGAIEHTKAYVRSDIRLGDGATGIRLAMPNPRVARIELEIEPAADVEQLDLRGIDASGNPTACWSATANNGRLGERQTFVLRTGCSSKMLKWSGSDFHRARWLDVEVTPRAGTEATLTVYRAAYLGDDGQE